MLVIALFITHLMYRFRFLMLGSTNIRYFLMKLAWIIAKVGLLFGAISERTTVQHDKTNEKKQYTR